MNIFNVVTGICSIAALILTLLQQRKINNVKEEVADAVKKVQTFHKRTTLSVFLGVIRDLSKELTSIANKTTRGKYRGGLGNELKTKIENFIGDLNEQKALFTDEQNNLIPAISEIVQAIDFDDIENNLNAARQLKSKFEILRSQFATYLSPFEGAIEDI